MKRKKKNMSTTTGGRIDRRRFLEGLTASAAALGAFSPRRSHAADAAPTAGGAVTGDSQPPPLKDLVGKVAYVTGASSGIGLATARVLREAGMRVAIGYIDEPQIREAMGFFKPDDPDLFAIRHDVMDREAWERTADEIDKRFGKVHLLVNNAGVGLSAKASSGTLKDWEWGVGVNFWGPVYGAYTYIPRMRAHNEGAHIATVCSISGMFAGSGNGIYTVSKYATCGLMEELRIELHETNIGTSVLFPGFTATNIGQAERYRPERLKNDPGAAPTALPRIATPAAAASAPRAAPRSQMDPMECARCLVDGILHNDLFIFSHPEWKTGTKMRFDAILASFLDRPVPPERIPADPLRTPVYAREIEHRRKTAKRTIKT
jgi:NAD(P)-dependent dehydrogenase (short-subunit alcohol dehydrogenase family)